MSDGHLGNNWADQGKGCIFDEARSGQVGKRLKALAEVSFVDSYAVRTGLAHTVDRITTADSSTSQAIRVCHH